MSTETLSPVEIREAPRPGSGMWFWDCTSCHCAFGPLSRDRGQAEQQGREHLATEHGEDAAPGLPGCHRCEKPITGTPVTDPDDPLGRQFCSEECADAEAEAAYEQQYRPGVAT